MKVSKKIILLLAGQFILGASINAMNLDVKATAEHAKHHDDKTEADCLTRLKAKIDADNKVKSEKEEPDHENGFLGALGNPEGPSLSALIAADNDVYKNKKNAAKIEHALKQNGSTESELFDRLPMELKVKVGQFYDKLVPNYVLRHKRELAPLLFGKPMANASDILELVDRDVARIKLGINTLRKEHIRLDPSHPEHIDNRPLVFVLSYRDRKRSCFFEETTPFANPAYFFVGDRTMIIAGYNDRTYDILLNDEQLKKLMDSYSLEQLTFFVSLAKIPASKSIARVPLSSKDREIFASLDAPMQAKLKRLYWWIDFHTPNDRALSIDEKIERAQNNIIAHVAYWLQWAKGLPFFCKNVGK